MRPICYMYVQHIVQVQMPTELYSVYVTRNVTELAILQPE
jgi:hypothetical protein